MQNREWAARKGTAKPKPAPPKAPTKGEALSQLNVRCSETKAAGIAIQAMVLHCKELRAALASDLAASDQCADPPVPPAHL